MHRFLALLLALAVPVASAQVYKWVDEKGRVHYGEKPPPGSKPNEVRPPTAPANTTGKAEDLKSQELEFRQRQLKRGQDEAKEARETANRVARCTSAKERLAISEQDLRYRRNQAEVENRRAAVTRFCG